jgi:hypothetical protein
VNTYVEAGGSSPLTALDTIDTGLGDLATANEVVINVSLPRHDESMKEKL